ncbi:MAG: LLM class flavin-dependent oxidoreductase [Chloroflexota bacterium]
MAFPTRLTFGIFLAPFHRHPENPTLAIDRDLELIEWLDQLGYDEAWIGEHHSAGWETIASPELFIAGAVQRTRHIKLGTGVVSLPYHHPLMVANRMVMLDHMSRGRVMLGVGPGALYTDAVMLGMETTQQRPRMEESLDVIVRLLRDDGPITHRSDWFSIVEGRLHLKPYTRPHFPIVVASAQSPTGMVLAGKYGFDVLSFSAYQGVRGAVDLKAQWRIAEETAAEHGTTMRREGWRLVVPVHVAESRAEAIEDVRQGSARFMKEYQGGVLGRHMPVDGPYEKIVDKMADTGSWLVGDPDDVVARLRQLDEVSGGYGGLMIMAHEWANREKTLKSYELFARYVMPHFQDSLTSLGASYDDAVAKAEVIKAAGIRAIEAAHQKYADQRAATTR